jgi:hypothetical protein
MLHCLQKNIAQQKVKNFTNIKKEFLMQLSLVFCFLCLSTTVFSMENFIKPQDINRLKTPQELLPKDIWEDCGNCCCRENDSNCPCGLISSSLVGCSVTLATVFKAYSSCSGLMDGALKQCVEAESKPGILIGMAGAVSTGWLACRLGDYATAQDEKREKMYAEYLKSMEKLSPRSREAHIKECMRERAKHIQNKID